MRAGLTQPSGDLGIKVMRQGIWKPDRSLLAEVKDDRNYRSVSGEWRRINIAQKLKIPTFFGQLRIAVIRADGRREDHGLVSLRVVTDTGVAYIVDAFQNIVEPENMKYHGIGTGGTAESAAQTALITELTTELNPNSTRATGTTSETAANIYQTVGTLTVDAAVAVTEHGVFSQAATGGGVMIDRSLFAAVNLASGDSIQTDYRLTFSSGG